MNVGDIMEGQEAWYILGVIDGESMDRLFGLRFARPSFDFSQSLSEYNRFPSPTEADYLALRADWRVVGNDLRRATKYFTKSASTQRTIRSFPEPADG